MFVPLPPPGYTNSFSKPTVTSRRCSQQKLSSTNDAFLLWDIMSLRFLLSLAALIYRSASIFCVACNAYNWNINFVRFRSTFAVTMEDQYGLTPKQIGYVLSLQGIHERFYRWHIFLQNTLFSRRTGIFSALSGFLSGPVANRFSSPCHQLYYATSVYVVALLGLAYAPNWEIMLVSNRIFNLLEEDSIRVVPHRCSCCYLLF